MARSFPVNAKGRSESEVHKKVEDDDSFNNLRLLPLAFKLSTSATTIDQGLLAIMCKLLLQIQMYRKKVQGSVFNSQCSCYYYFVHFISFKTYG